MTEMSKEVALAIKTLIEYCDNTSCCSECDLHIDGNCYGILTEWSEIAAEKFPSLNEIKPDTYREGVEDGMKQAWELSKQIVGLESAQIKEIFGIPYKKFSIFQHYTPQRAKELFDKWKEKQIKVGDIVRSKDKPGSIAIITGVEYIYGQEPNKKIYNLLYTSGLVANGYTEDQLERIEGNRRTELLSLLELIENKAKSVKENE